jgi:hypothetical protein
MRRSGASLSRGKRLKVNRWIGALILFGLATVIVSVRRHGNKTGSMPVKGPAIERSDYPRIFKVASIMYLGLAWAAAIAAVIAAAGLDPSLN